MKTVLAPGAPWPKQVDPVKPVEPVEPAKAPVKPKPKPKKKPSKIARTTAKYIEWAGRNLESAL